MCPSNPGIILCMSPANERRRWMQRRLSLAGPIHRMVTETLLVINYFEYVFDDQTKMADIGNGGHWKLAENWRTLKMADIGNGGRNPTRCGDEGWIIKQMSILCSDVRSPLPVTFITEDCEFDLRIWQQKFVRHNIVYKRFSVPVHNCSKRCNDQTCRWVIIMGS